MEVKTHQKEHRFSESFYTKETILSFDDLNLDINIFLHHLAADGTHHVAPNIPKFGVFPHKQLNDKRVFCGHSAYSDSYFPFSQKQGFQFYVDSDVLYDIRYDEFQIFANYSTSGQKRFFLSLDEEIPNFYNVNELFHPKFQSGTVKNLRDKESKYFCIFIKYRENGKKIKGMSVCVTDMDEIILPNDDKSIFINISNFEINDVLQSIELPSVVSPGSKVSKIRDNIGTIIKMSFE